ncbi:MAG: hypothetical protein HXS44_16250 [Theionarchaea archaeon]|nr:hypothetical protein [Theionarchaea archaeon]
MLMKRNFEKKLLLDDEPIETEEMDEFRHSVFVDVLFDLIKDIKEPCNIGLFGKWGTGKTSIVRMLFNRARNDKRLSKTTRCVYFDAWRYSNDSLRTQLLIELDEALGRPIGKKKIIDILYNIQEEEVEDEPKTTLERITRFLASLKVFWIFFIGIIITDLLIFFLTDAEIANILTASVIIPLIAELISKMNTLNSSVRKRRILPKKEWIGEFESLFKEIISKTNTKRIVIAIDNLDRCQSQTVTQTLILLKTFMGIPKCIYIVPCDEEAVLGHITALNKEKGYLTEDGLEFLQKIFQIMIKIPPFLAESLEEYAQNLRSQMQISFDEGVQDVILNAHAENPRRIIHAFNRLTALCLLAKKKEEEKQINSGIITDNLPFLAKISIIEDQWKDFYKDLSHNPFLLHEIETYFRGIPLSKETPEKVYKHFEENPELISFLNATRTVMVDDVKPFLLLSQGLYESLIPELKLLRQCIMKNDIIQVRDILKRTPDNEKLSYVKAILEICRDLVQCGRYNLGFNCINIVSHTYGLLPDEFHTEIAKDLGSYLGKKGLVEFLPLFNIEKLFEILPHMPVAMKDNILSNLLSSFFSENCKNNAILNKLIERSDLVGQKQKKELNDYLFRNLNSRELEIAKNIIQIVSQNDRARENLLEKELLCKYIEIMESAKVEGSRYPKGGGTPYQKIKRASISKELQIRVQKLYGNLEEVVVQISSNASFRELFEKAETKIDLESQNYALVFQGRILLPYKSLSEEGIEDGYCIGVIPEPWYQEIS